MEIDSYTCKQCGGPLNVYDPLCPYCKVPWSKAHPVSNNPAVIILSPGTRTTYATTGIVLTTGSTTGMINRIGYSQ